MQKCLVGLLWLLVLVEKGFVYKNGIDLGFFIIFLKNCAYIQK